MAEKSKKERIREQTRKRTARYREKKVLQKLSEPSVTHVTQPISEKYEIPAHLQPRTKKFFKQVIADYQMESHHIGLLTMACEAWERARDAELILNEKGLTYTDRYGCPRVNPEVKIKEQAEIIFARLIRELNLDIESPRSGSGRPPSL